MDFDMIDLKPLSQKILVQLSIQDDVRAHEIAEKLDLSPRQVDAAVTRSLVRYGLVIREAQLTKVMKKEFNKLKITKRGKDYVAWLEKN